MYTRWMALLRTVAIGAVALGLFPGVVAQSTNADSGSESPTVVCIAGQCLQGFSNVTIGAVLSADGAPTSIRLLPGTYTATTNPQLLHDILSSSSASLVTSPGFENITTPPSSTSFTLPLDVKLQPGLAVYTLPLYGGDAGFSALNTNQPFGNDTQIQLTAGSIALSENVWISLRSSSDEPRTVVWDSIPDVNQLPQLLSSSSTSTSSQLLTLLDIQSSSCSPPCSSSGVCSPSTSTCICPPNFTGSSCEQCAPGHFGPECRPCPQSTNDGGDCEQCDEGVQGTGACLKRVLGGDERPGNCDCENGSCGSNGQCECLEGWEDGGDGKKCSTCKRGFFLTSTGDCQVCQLGCDDCADTTGACLACTPQFSLDPSDRTKCNPPITQTSSGQQCGDGSFGDGAKCSVCSPTCSTCIGPTSNDCTLCAQGTYMLNGSCVRTSAEGVCEGTTLIADNLKSECDSCGSKCTTCRIQGFSVASTPDQVECTGCLPGFVLSQGKCVESCPSGTVVSPQDNVTCIPCSSSCSTCAGTPDFCLTCTANQLAFNGRCISSCPPGSFSSGTGAGSACLNCHPDCASCTGSSFNQCSSCPPNRPVLAADGRCLPTCSKSQYFDSASGSCRDCDSSCGSCLGPGREECLSCSGDDRALEGGSCVAVDCSEGLPQGSSGATGGTTIGANGAVGGVIPGLGVCLSQIIRVPSPTDGGEPALPTITGLDNPTVVESSSKPPLEWWQILLMALGCAFIVLVTLICWRRRAIKKRQERTKMFADAKRLNEKSGGLRERLIRFGERFFGHGNWTAPHESARGQRGGERYRDMDGDSLERGGYRDYPEYEDDDGHAMKMKKLPSGREGSRRSWDDGKYSARRTTQSGFSKYIDGYADRSTHKTGTTSKSSSRSRRYRDDGYTYRRQEGEDESDSRSRQRRLGELLDGASLYSEYTKNPRKGPDPRQPFKSTQSSSETVGLKRLDLLPKAKDLEKSRHSISTIGSSWFPNRHGKVGEGNLISVDEAVPPLPTEAQVYAMTVKPELMASLGGDGSGSRGQYWMQPNMTGTTATSSKNPFRQKEYQQQQWLN